MQKHPGRGHKFVPTQSELNLAQLAADYGAGTEAIRQSMHNAETGTPPAPETFRKNVRPDLFIKHECLKHAALDYAQNVMDHGSNADKLKITVMVIRGMSPPPEIVSKFIINDAHERLTAKISKMMNGPQIPHPPRQLQLVDDTDNWNA